MRSLKEERDRLHAAVAAAEDDASSLSREKARYMQQSDEAENALERCRVSLYTNEVDDVCVRESKNVWWELYGEKYIYIWCAF